MDGLVGYSGFVGGNLLRQHTFGGQYNRANIATLHGQTFDRLVVSAAPATMWLANNDPDADRQNILDLCENLAKASAGTVILISTIAVLADASKPDDERSAAYETQLAYGRHRRELETRVQDMFERTLILRLPALFGADLKKNFLFDMMNPVPSFLKPDVFQHLADIAGQAGDDLVNAAFEWDAGAGMYRFRRDAYVAGPDADAIKALCTKADISALAFTNAQSQFQFYNLANLWADIEKALSIDIEILNLATEPMLAGDIHREIFGTEMPYETAPRVTQDMRSQHAHHWGGADGYLAGRDEILTGIRDLMGDRT